MILEIALFADLGVTASSILKLNRQLDAMEKIAAELRELSDKVGANIYENVTDVMEFHEKAQETLEEVTEEGRRRMEEHVQKLRERYEELASSSARRSARFLKAFPTMRFAGISISWRNCGSGSTSGDNIQSPFVLLNKPEISIYDKDTRLRNFQFFLFTGFPQ